MDFSHIVKADSGPSLMPLLIFGLWLIISMISGSQAKKRKRQAQQQGGKAVPAHENAPPASGGGQGWNGEDPMAEIRRRLETLLADRRQPETETPETRAQPRETQESVFVRKEQPDLRKTVPHPKPPERPAHRHQTLETADTFDTREVHYQNYEQKPAKPAAAVTVPAPAPAAAVPEQQPEEYAVLLPSLGSLEQARAGVLWSEILGPPLALRE